MNSRYEMIALELTKQFAKPYNYTKEEYLETYDYFLKGLKGSEVSENNGQLAKLQDELWTYKRCIERLGTRLNGTNNNFLLKEEIEAIIGGLLND